MIRSEYEIASKEVRRYVALIAKRKAAGLDTSGDELSLAEAKRKQKWALESGLMRL